MGGLAIAWVIFEYIFIGSMRAIPIVKSISIHLDEFKQHDVVMVQHQQIPFVLIHRTEQQIKRLKDKYPEKNALRSLNDEYFIALAIGTDFGCVVTKFKEDLLKEACSPALYDYTGRAQSAKNDPLLVPTMTYNQSTQRYNLTLK